MQLQVLIKEYQEHRVFYTAAALVCLSLVAACLLGSAVWLLALVCCLVAVVCVYCCFSLRRRITLLLFTVSFFTFLVGKSLIQAVQGQLDEVADWKTFLLLFLSLGMLWLGYVLGEKKRPKYRVKISGIGFLRDGSGIEKASAVLYYLTLVFACLVELEAALAVIRHGYIYLYNEFSSRIPFVVHKLAVMNDAMFLIYLATFPRAKRFYWALGGYVLYLILTLLTGVRGTLLVNLFFLLVYILIRNGCRQYEPVFTAKWIKWAFVIGGVALVAFLGVYSQIRAKTESVGIMNGLLNFFVEQGVSINVLSYSVAHQEQFHGLYPLYSGYSLINYNGLLQRAFSFLKSFSTEPTAAYLGNLGYTAIYFIDPVIYAAGGALGSQYIAELYLDFSWYGAALVNFCIGWLLQWLTRMENRSPVLNLYGFAMLRMLFFLPRDTLLSFLTCLLSATYALGWIAVVLLAYFLRHVSLGRLHTAKRRLDA